MGRRWAAAVTAVVVAVGLVGCSDAPIVGDGSLGTEWALLPTPSVPMPETGVCTTASGRQVATWTLTFLPGETVDCAESHLTETYHVGTFPADVDTDPTTVPTLGTARFRSAFTECLAKASEFLGGDARASRVAVIPVMPSDRQWAGQARWFRCELIELVGLDRTIMARRGSLRGAARDDGPLATTCANVTVTGSPGRVSALAFVTCDQEHDVEMTGAHTLPDGEYPGGSGGLVNAGCRSVSASYIGITVSQLLPPGSDTFAFGTDPTEDQWQAGVRSGWCFYGSMERSRTGSIRGLAEPPYS